MSEQDKYDRLLARYPRQREFPVLRPHWTRRRFFEVEQQFAARGMSHSARAHPPHREKRQRHRQQISAARTQPPRHRIGEAVRFGIEPRAADAAK